jgi:hypothetical protein
LLIASAALFATAEADPEQARAVGMVTRISGERGVVEVMPQGGLHWKPARPLLALRSGDTLRATADASVIVILSGGASPVTIDSTNSPFMVPARQPNLTRSEKAVALLRVIIDYLSSHTQDKLAPVLVTRHSLVSPTILSPRNGPMLPGPLIFDWSPNRSGSATVTVLSTTRILLSQTDVTATTLGYPDAAPMLVSGERYRLRIQEARRPPLETWFEIVGTERADAVRRSLADLEQVVPAEAPASSVAIIKAGYLAQQGLFHDARVLLLAALAQDTRDPALHLLLGHVYSETGLPELATESYRRAWLLLAHNEGRSSSR